MQSSSATPPSAITPQEYRASLWGGSSLAVKPPKMKRPAPHNNPFINKKRCAEVVHLINQCNEVCDIVTDLDLRQSSVLKQGRAAMEKAVKAMNCISIEMPDPKNSCTTMTVLNTSLSAKAAQKAENKMTSALNIAHAALRKSERANSGAVAPLTACEATVSVLADGVKSMSMDKN